MDLQELPGMFRSAVKVEPEFGCWVWSGPTTPTGYPAYKRQSAWMWAYRHVNGDLPKGEYPVIGACHGPIICANPNHRTQLPIDLAQQPHRCPTCRKWHDPDEEYSPPVRNHSLERSTIQRIGPDPQLTPKQESLEEMMEE